MLLWPNLVIKLHDNGLENEETNRIVLPTFLFAGTFMPEYLIKMSLAILLNNSREQNQTVRNPLQIYMSQL